MRPQPSLKTKIAQVVFGCNFMAIVPLASILGAATEASVVVAAAVIRAITVTMSTGDLGDSSRGRPW